MIKEIEADKDVSNTQVTKKIKTKPKKGMSIPGSAVTLEAKTFDAKAADVTKQQKLQKSIQLDEDSTKSKTTHQQQVKAIEKTKKKKLETKKTPTSKVKNVQIQPIKNLSQDPVTKNISKEIESKHQ